MVQCLGGAVLRLELGATCDAERLEHGRGLAVALLHLRRDGERLGKQVQRVDGEEAHAVEHLGEELVQQRDDHCRVGGSRREVDAIDAVALSLVRLARGRGVDLVYASAAGAAAATQAHKIPPRNNATSRTIVAGQPSCPKSNAAAVRGEPLVDSAAKSILERAQPARVNRGGGGRHRAHAPNRAQARGGSSARSGAGKRDRGTRVQCTGNNRRHRLRGSGKAMRPARMRKAMMLRARISAAELADWSRLAPLLVHHYVCIAVWWIRANGYS